MFLNYIFSMGLLGWVVRWMLLGLGIIVALLRRTIRQDATATETHFNYLGACFLGASFFALASRAYALADGSWLTWPYAVWGFVGILPLTLELAPLAVHLNAETDEEASERANKSTSIGLAVSVVTYWLVFLFPRTALSLPGVLPFLYTVSNLTDWLTSFWFVRLIVAWRILSVLGSVLLTIPMVVFVSIGGLIAWLGEIWSNRRRARELTPSDPDIHPGVCSTASDRYEDESSELGEQAACPLSPVPQSRNHGLRTFGAIAAIAVVTSASLPYWPRGTRELLVIIGLLAVATLTHLMGFAIAGRLAGIQLLEFSLFMGPKAWEWWSGKTAYVVRWLPTGGFVQFRGMQPDDPVETGSFRSLHPLQRATVVLAGPASLLLLSAVMLGGAQAATAFTSGFVQIIQLVTSPLSGGKELILKLLQLAASADLLSLLGLLAVKMAAWNCLPLPLLNGGQALTELIRWQRTGTANAEKLLALFGLVVSGLIFISVAVAVVSALIQLSRNL